ncbi:hypothetical protein FOA52_003934 [Chlamydomonas sp. UWO 241]|nr:hypothetical protein FOA52_003934 [Chlamydomonas sp. UWO 241]
MQSSLVRTRAVRVQQAARQPRQVPCHAMRPHAAAAAALATAASLLLLSGSVLADDLGPISAVFDSKCAGCHMGGGNNLQAGATLFEGDLAKNGVESPEALYKIIYSGKGKMPGYGTDCAPRGACTFAARLPDSQIQALADYVKERAAAQWKS